MSDRGEPEPPRKMSRRAAWFWIVVFSATFYVAALVGLLKLGAWLRTEE